MKYAFRISGRLKPKPPERRKSEVPTSVEVDKQAICERCEWYQSSVKRCQRANSRDWSVCYNSSYRIEPWKRIRFCPNWNLASRLHEQV